MKLIILLFVFSSILSCQNRDENVDIELLTGFDYRIFQNTEVWGLAKVVEDQNIELIESIVNKGSIDINTIDPKYGHTLLMMTVLNNQFKSFKCLIKLGADINIHSTFDSSSALHLASEYLPIETDLEYIIILVQEGADVNDISNSRYTNTPLLHACARIFSTQSHLETVKFLVSKGANINYNNNNKNEDNFALKVSIIHNNYDVALFLIKNGADYTRPFYLKEDKIRKKNDYIMDVLAHSFINLESPRYVDKMILVKYLEEQGLKYKRIQSVNKRNLIKLKRMYPDSWEEYLKVY